MKLLLFLIFAASTLLGCKKNVAVSTFQDDKSLTNPYGNWRLISREDLTTGKVYHEPSSLNSTCTGNQDCFIRLNLSTVYFDSITGSTPLNLLKGAFWYDGASRDFYPTSFWSTKVGGEDKWVDVFTESMHLVREFGVNNLYLRLYYNNRKNSFTFRRL